MYTLSCFFRNKYWTNKKKLSRNEASFTEITWLWPFDSRSESL